MQIKIPYKDVPMDIKKDINRFTSDSTIALIGYDHNNQPIDGFLASGSLVIINSIYGVLTAKHVWQEFKKKATYLSFCVIGKIHYIHEKIEHLNCYLPEDEVDICFIELPPTILGTIKAVRTFHPIISNNFPDIEDIKHTICVTVGFPLIIQSKNDRRINIFRYYTHLTDYNKISEDWDIIELDIQTESAPYELPKSFGGMSGGGIWNFNCFYNDDTGVIKYFIKHSPKDAFIAGVNYYQKCSNNKVNRICGVGPVSIYSGMTKLVKK